MADRRTSGATYRSTHNGTILARTFGGDRTAYGTPHGAADDCTIFTAHRLPHGGTGCSTHATTQNSAQIICMGTRQHQKTK